MPDLDVAAPDGGRTVSSADRVRMPLIELIASEALDEEYAEVARGRPPRAPGERRPLPGVLGAVAVLLFAVLVTISFQQTRSNESVNDAGRASLEDRIRARREVVSRQQDRIVELRSANTATDTEVELLDRSITDITARLKALGLASGFEAVTGPGVRIVVGDAPGGVRVYDEDLALLTNGLFEAGAEAIAVNGQRLTALSAFRFSGTTIRINDTNLTPPYTVEAIGDDRTLQADLLDTTSGLAFRARSDEFGFALTMQNETRLSLPAAPASLTRLRSARPGSAAGRGTPGKEEHS